MRTETHVVFSLGIAVLAASLMSSWLPGTLTCMAPTILGAAAIHPIIDALSHEVRGGYTSRSRLLHSLETLAPISAAAGAVVGGLASPTIACVGGGAALFLISALSHLLLDYLNPGGVWILGRKLALPLGRWDDPFLNGAASLAGVAALFVGLLEMLGS